MPNTYFITTSIPYVNSIPHVGHAQEFALTDALARFYRLKNAKVILQSGTDDNAFKNVISAKAAGYETKTFVDQNAQAFSDLLSSLNINPDYFVRTSSVDHAKGVQAFIKQLNSEDLYTKNYTGLYCQGCEDFYHSSELKDGLCPDHLKPPEEINEQNIFFSLSKYQSQIFDCINSDRVLITPSFRKSEILIFISAGLKDISISRSAVRSAGWGIPFPGYPDQVVYVWIDALINYLTGAGYGRSENWKGVWNDDVYKIHVIGKNVWKFHAIYWLGLLLSAKLALPNEIFIHGFLTKNGIKISKSLGNGGNLKELIISYGADAIRFYLLSGLSVYDDADFSESDLLKFYNSDLANKIGNVASRILTLRKRAVEQPKVSIAQSEQPENFQHGIKLAFEIIHRLNFEIDSVKPWELLKFNRRLELNIHLERWLTQLQLLSHLLLPVIPNVATKLKEYIVDPGAEIGQLFPRK